MKLGTAIRQLEAETEGAKNVRRKIPSRVTNVYRKQPRHHGRLCGLLAGNRDRVPFINPLTPNVNYSGRTAPLTSKVAFYIFIQQI